MSMATITIDYYKAFGLTKSPLFGAACIDQVSSYLEGAKQVPLRAFTKIGGSSFCRNFTVKSERKKFYSKIGGS